MTATLELIAPTAPEPTAVPIGQVREAQTLWAATPIRQRLRVLRHLRHAIAADGEALAAAIPTPNRTLGEKLVSEVLPLAEAIRFLERRAAAVLRPARWGATARPVWLWGVRLRVEREPLGVVLIVSPSNYPLLLLGVQAVQALAAGNAVLIKPAPRCAAVAERFASLARGAGLSAGLLTVLPEATTAVVDAIEAGLDKVLFTGSSGAGRAVLRMAAEAGIPATVELSGNDPVFICPDANLAMAARAVAFGTRFNAGETCIAPGRVFVGVEQFEPFLQQLEAACNALEPVLVPSKTIQLLRQCVDEIQATGGRVVCGGVDADGGVRPIVITQPAVPSRLLGEGVFGPIVVVVRVTGELDDPQVQALCPLHLGATVFGEAEAMKLAKRINAGVVVINDMLVPHADPRLPFGGRGASGFGVTRGLEGLLELTRPKAISVRHGKLRPHFAPLRPAQDALFTGLLQLRHGSGLRNRIGALAKLIRAGSAGSKRT